jgi:Fe-S cluster assembly scaffold protein SufB
VLEFEKLYSDANQHGLALNGTMLTLALLESSMLTKDQESWSLQTVAGDLTRYQDIRRALRRMPELDARHRDASAWALNATPEEQSWSENAELQKNAYQQYSDPSASPSQVSPYSFQDNRLNSAPPEPRNSSAIQGWFADDSDSDDDYC